LFIKGLLVDMPKTSTALLVASLVSNMVLMGLLISTTYRIDSNSVLGKDARAATKSGTHVAGQSRESSKREIHSQSLRDLAQAMRRDGFPPSMIRSAVVHALNLEYEGKIADLLLPKTSPYWKAFVPPNERVRMELDQIEDEKRRRLAEILRGIAEAAYDSELAKRRREKTWGNLSDDKIATVNRINRDFDNLVRSGRAFDTEAERLEAERLLHQERYRDIAAVLTPVEYQDYLRRQERGAPRLMAELAAIDITEDEYEKLFDSRLHAETTTRFQPTNLDTLLAGRVAYNASNAEFRAILGDERFASYLRQHDQDYAIVDTLARALGLPAATALRYYEQRAILENESHRILGNGVLTADEKRQELARLEFQARSNLKIALGESVYAEIDDKVGGWLKRLQTMRERLVQTPSQK
jgi:hypothetical protein